jgi:ABC-type branched-subunit amino acid transport system ATPase component
MLAILKALMQHPKLLLLDEASSVFSPKLHMQIFLRLVSMKTAKLRYYFTRTDCKKAGETADT